MLNLIIWYYDLDNMVVNHTIENNYFNIVTMRLNYENTDKVWIDFR